MKTLATAILGTLLVAAVCPANADIRGLEGQWVNQNPGAAPSRLHIVRQDTVVTVRAWGSCGTNACDWGRATARIYGAGPQFNALKTARVATVTFRRGVRVRRIIIRPTAPGKLDALELTQVTGRRESYSRTHVFRAASRRVLPSEANCIKFKLAAIKVLPLNAEWRLVASGRVLKSFGAQRKTAYRAQDIIRRYRFDKHCVIGRPPRSFEYWLVKDRLPSGALKGERCFGIAPDQVQIKRSGRAWSLVQRGRTLRAFRTRRSAGTVLATMRGYGARYLCEIGVTPNSMTYIRR